jgi:hypothetical protein
VIDNEISSDVLNTEQELVDAEKVTFSIPIEEARNDDC